MLTVACDTGFALVQPRSCDGRFSHLLTPAVLCVCACLSSTLLQVAEQSGAKVELDLVHGNCRHSVTNTICAKVQDLAAELVVLTVQRKRSFIEELFQAPIGKQVADVCPCPTLIIPDACC